MMRTMTLRSARDQARALALARVAAGLLFAAAPRQAGGLLVGPAAGRPGAGLFVRAFGARDALLGAGVLRALGAGDPVRPWVAACSAADAFDAAATLAAYGELAGTRRALTFAVSLAPAVAGGLVAARLGADRPPT